MLGTLAGPTLCLAFCANGLVATPALAQQPRAEERTLVLTAGDAVAQAHGRALTFEYVVGAGGALHVWAISSDCDPRLTIVGADGAALAEDGDSGGGTAAFVSLRVEAGAELSITALSESPDALGSIHVSLRERPESDATRTLAGELRSAVRDAVRLRAEMRHAQARERLSGARTALLACAEATNSEEVLTASLDVLRDAYHLDQTDVARDVARFRRDAFERLYPPDCTPLQEARLMLGSLLGETEDADQGSALIEQACAVYRRTLTRDEPELPAALVTAGQFAFEHGDLERAIACLREGLAGIERTSPTNVKKIAVARMALGVALSEFGSLDEARMLEEQAVAAMERVFGPDDPFRLGAQTNLGATLSMLGDHQGALIVHQRVLAIQQRNASPDAHDRLDSRMNVGVQLLSLGRTDEALALFQEVVADSADAPTWSFKRRVRVRTNLAVALDDAGRHEESIALLDELLREPSWPTVNDYDLLWRIEAESAIAHQELGRGREALEHARRAIALIAPRHAANWPDLLDMRNLLAKIALGAGQRDEALAQARLAAGNAKAYFAQCAATMSPRQAEAVQFNWSRLVADPLDVFARVATDDDREALDALAFELVESARNVASGSIRVEHELATNPARDEIERLRDEIRRQSHEIAKVAVREGGEEDVRVHTTAKEAAERELRLLMARSSSARLLDVDADEMAGSLPTDAAAISYWSYEDRRETVKQHVRRPRLLVAFVVRRDRPVVRVELGSVLPIRSACQAWREALLGDEAAVARERGEALRRLVLDPLSAALGTTTVWHVALDDELQIVPLDALPDGDALLGDRASILTTPTLGELARDAVSTPSDGLFVAVGGVDYDHARDGHPRAQASPARASTSALRTGLRGDFEPLWDTAGEVAQIAALYRQRSAEAKVELLEERDATKSALLELAPRARFLHVATHGFFAPESVAAIGDRAVQPSDDPLSTPETAISVAGFAPLALCGLALSGANLAPDDDHADEGCITAEELAHVDLDDCELVVLSACDTNVGFLRAGRGVASFQKALHSAGARNVITSLWKVSDDATRELMLEFYKALWVDGRSKPDALWHAKQALRARRAPARDYAAWVLSG